MEGTGFMYGGNRVYVWREQGLCMEGTGVRILIPMGTGFVIAKEEAKYIL